MQNIAARFFQIDHWHSATPIGKGNINDTYQVLFSEKGEVRKFVVQRLNHLVFRQPEAVMANWEAAAAHLARRADYPYQIPTPLPAHDGSFLQKDEAGNYWRAFEFLENTFSPETAATPEVAFEAARAYGAFLRALGDFPATRLTEVIPGFHDTERRWLVFEKTLKENPAGRLQSALPEIENMRAARPLLRKVARLKKSGELPLRATHNDTKAGNVLLDATSGKAIAVIDLDTLMPGTALSDFGDMLRSFAPDRHESDPDAAGLSLKMDVVEGMCRGFLSETRDFLTPTERENLFLGGQWIIAEQALRFLNDYLAGDVYYKVSDPAQNLVRARNQLALLQRVTEQRRRIRGFLKKT